MSGQESHAAWLHRRWNVAIGIGLVLRLALLLVPYCVCTFAAVGFEAASDWLYDHAGIEQAERWKDGIRGR